jgi:hypothetical protein
MRGNRNKLASLSSNRAAYLSDHIFIFEDMTNEEIVITTTTGMLSYCHRILLTELGMREDTENADKHIRRHCSKAHEGKEEGRKGDRKDYLNNSEINFSR